MSLEAFLLFSFPFFGTPIVVGLAWWAWFKRASTHSSRWRAVMLFIGLAAVSIDAAMYYGWFAYHTATNGSAFAWSLKDVVADNVGIPLAGIGLACGLFGKGSTRILVALTAVTEVLLWSKFGVL